MTKHTKKKNKNYIVAQNAKELGKAIGLAPTDIALMEYKSNLTILAAKAIEESGESVSELARKSGISRARISQVKNYSSTKISCDLLVKIIAATGKKVATPKAA